LTQLKVICVNANAAPSRFFWAAILPNFVTRDFQHAIASRLVLPGRVISSCRNAFRASWSYTLRIPMIWPTLPSSRIRQTICYNDERLSRFRQSTHSAGQRVLDGRVRDPFLEHFEQPSSPLDGTKGRGVGETMTRKKATLLLLCLTAGVAYLAYYQFWDMAALVRREAALRDGIARHPIFGSLIGFVIYTVLCFVPGAGGKSLIVGWLFGFWSALIQVNLGLTLTAMVTFWLSRYLFGESVHRSLGGAIAHLDRAIARDGAYYLFAMRVLHAPYTITNYALGATSIRSSDYWWATQLGMLPGNIAFVYAGTQFPSLEQLSREGPRSVFTGPLFIALTVVGLLPLLVRVCLRRFRKDIAFRAD